MTKGIIALTEKTPAPATLLAALRTGGSDLGSPGGSLVWTYHLTWLDGVCGKPRPRVESDTPKRSPATDPSTVTDRFKAPLA
ncbi:hypothetical protein ABT187_41375 [Streptomyces sp. NPDC001817]|uniref:hypothetical protein n=1 Tax=Streptomyces sp. NPDC001817 TaxID=3154398 RepID=UPI0033255237